MTVDRIETPSFPEGGYIEIWSLNRPNRLNALNRDMHEELIGLCERAESDDSTRVVVITGTEPEKNADRPKPVAFAAGADDGAAAARRGTVALVSRCGRQHSV